MCRPVWLGYLPIRDDEDEARVVHAQLLRLIKSRNAHLCSSNALPKVLPKVPLFLSCSTHCTAMHCTALHCHVVLCDLLALLDSTVVRSMFPIPPPVLTIMLFLCVQVATIMLQVLAEKQSLADSATTAAMAAVLKQLLSTPHVRLNRYTFATLACPLCCSISGFVWLLRCQTHYPALSCPASANCRGRTCPRQ